MNEHIKYMFDTVAFNRVVDQDISVASLDKCCEIYTTHVQRDELSKTANCEKKAKLLEVCGWVEASGPSDSEGLVPTESFVLGKSRLDRAKLSDGSLYNGILSALDKCKEKDNNKEDALIAETAIKNDFILVTDDTYLQVAAREQGGECISFKGFAQRCLKCKDDRADQ